MWKLDALTLHFLKSFVLKENPRPKKAQQLYNTICQKHLKEVCTK